MLYLEDSTPDPTHARRPDFSRARTQGSLVAGVAGRVAARLKADGDANRSMLLLTAKAAREIVEAIEANTEARKRVEGEVGDVKEILKRIEGKAMTRRQP